MVNVMTRTVDPRLVAESVTDPELPMISLADLGVLRDVRIERDEGGLQPLKVNLIAADCLPGRLDGRPELVRAFFKQVRVQPSLTQLPTPEAVGEPNSYGCQPSRR